MIPPYYYIDVQLIIAHFYQKIRFFLCIIFSIHKSYKSAKTAYQLTKTTIPRNFLTYEELGIYQLLTDYSEKTIYPNFVEETLGKLIDYDKKNQTDYMHILETYFENECSIICTSKALYCHKNTLSYKIGKIMLHSFSK